MDVPPSKLKEEEGEEAEEDESESAQLSSILDGNDTTEVEANIDSFTQSQKDDSYKTKPNQEAPSKCTTFVSSSNKKRSSLNSLPLPWVAVVHRKVSRPLVEMSETSLLTEIQRY